LASRGSYEDLKEATATCGRAERKRGY